MTETNFLKTKVVFALCATFMLLPNLALSDDAPIRFTSGGIKLYDDKETSVSLDSETVEIELGRRTHTIDATFEFFNHGETITLMVGFPKWGCGDIRDFTGVEDFISLETWVNGEKLSFKEVRDEVTASYSLVPHPQEKDIIREIYYELNSVLEKYWKLKDSLGVISIVQTKWYIKEVTFKGYEKTTTRVRYTDWYNIESWPCTGTYLNYIYGTGKSWKGNIGKARFIVKDSLNFGVFWFPVDFVEGPGNWYPVSSGERMWSSENVRNKICHKIHNCISKNLSTKVEYVLKDFEPQEEEVFRVTIIDNPIDYLGCIAFDSVYFASKTLPFMEYLEKAYIPYEVLESLTLSQLRILRNAYFALHGRIFKSPELDSYFRKNEWYKPREDFKETDLTEIERKNVEKILEYEKRIKEKMKSN
jgi:hypothetical protein